MLNALPSYFRPGWIRPDDRELRVDACVYGASAAGVTAAVELANRGLRVELLQPGKAVGGMTTGGLGWTDFGRKHAVGGAARRFYEAVGARYGKDEEWRFEPSVAAAVLAAKLAEAGVVPRTCQYLDAVEMKRVGANPRIAAIRTLGGLTVRARGFVDATYEGDLMAAAGVPFHVGREGNAVYGETLNGVQVRNGADDFNADHHQFDAHASPFVVEDDPSSGLLPGILGRDVAAETGTGDDRVQAYNFRVCMTDDPALRVPWQKPAGYDPADHVLLERWLRSDKSAFNEQVHPDAADPAERTRPRKFDVLPNPTPGGFSKTDSNNHGAVSSDFIGGSHGWPNGSHEKREEIFQAHLRWQMGLYWHVANAPGIPEKYRAAYRRWGLPSDEFTRTGHWPHQLYVREARRMVSDHVITEHDCNGDRRAEDSVGLASYTMDSHHTARFVRVVDGKPRVMNEGNVEVFPTAPFAISYRSVVSGRGRADNLFVPVCLSASHIAYGSARMEPVFMVLGQSVGIAAALCVEADCPAQDLPYAELRPELEAAGQVLEAGTQEPTPPAVAAAVPRPPAAVPA